MLQTLLYKTMGGLIYFLFKLILFGLFVIGVYQCQHILKQLNPQFIGVCLFLFICTSYL
jgi:hypothetical protein